MRDTKPVACLCAVLVVSTLPSRRPRGRRPASRPRPADTWEVVVVGRDGRRSNFFSSPSFHSQPGGSVFRIGALPPLIRSARITRDTSYTNKRARFCCAMHTGSRGESSEHLWYNGKPQTATTYKRRQHTCCKRSPGRRPTG